MRSLYGPYKQCRAQLWGGVEAVGQERQQRQSAPPGGCLRKIVHVSCLL